MKLAPLLMLLAACPGPSGVTPPPKQPPPSDPNPGLVVLVIIDQFPEWTFEHKRPHLTGGFARMLSEGEWRVGRHPSAASVTAPGHALLGTGQSPAASGIIANRWFDRALGKVVKAGSDEHGQPSTKWLRVAGLGDAVAAANTGAKAVSVALKNRAALLALGHRGLALYYDADAAAFTALGVPPAWLAAHNRQQAIPTRLAPWQPLDPARIAKLAGVPDNNKGEVGSKGFGTTFPYDPQATKKPADAVHAMPLGNDVVLETALAAIDGEQLGADRAIDLLILSLSAHDYISHGWGHESWEAWDSELRLDAALDRFMHELDRKLGTQRWALIVTSDHGGAPLPDMHGGGRYTEEQIMLAANNAAKLELGGGDWIADAGNPFIWLTPAALAHKDIERAKKKIDFALRAFPGLSHTGRVETFAGRCDERKGDERMICLAIDRERAGDFFYFPAKHWIIEEVDERLATAHGSLNDYDRDVPVLLLPFGRTKHAPLTAPAGELPLEAVAPTVAKWLGVPSPTTIAR